MTNLKYKAIKVNILVIHVNDNNVETHFSNSDITLF